MPYGDAGGFPVPPWQDPNASAALALWFRGRRAALQAPRGHRKRGEEHRARPMLVFSWGRGHRTQRPHAAALPPRGSASAGPELACCETLCALLLPASRLNLPDVHARPWSGLRLGGGGGGACSIVASAGAVVPSPKSRDSGF